MARHLILVSRFNELITKALLTGAEDALAEAGATEHDTLWVPGCFELPMLAAQAARSGAYASVICLGAVIRGETPHFDYVAGETAAGLMRVGIETGVPVIFGVLTTDTADQALARCGIKGGNKGREAAATALAMIKTKGRLTELAGKR